MTYAVKKLSSHSFKFSIQIQRELLEVFFNHIFRLFFFSFSHEEKNFLLVVKMTCQSYLVLVNYSFLVYPITLLCSTGYIKLANDAN